MARHVFVRQVFLAIALFLFVFGAGCGSPSGPVLIGSYSLDNRDGLIAGEDIADIDNELSTDGGGSLHIYSEGKMLINLFEIPLESFKGDTVIARCTMRSESLSGWTNFELWVFPKDGDPRSTLQTCDKVGRTRDWMDVEVVFPLEPGETLEKLRIAVRLSGRGHLWVDDLQIFSARASDMDQ